MLLAGMVSMVVVVVSVMVVCVMVMRMGPLVAELVLFGPAERPAEFALGVVRRDDIGAEAARRLLFAWRGRLQVLVLVAMMMVAMMVMMMSLRLLLRARSGWKCARLMMSA